MARNERRREQAPARNRSSQSKRGELYVVTGDHVEGFLNRIFGGDDLDDDDQADELDDDQDDDQDDDDQDPDPDPAPKRRGYFRDKGGRG